MKIVVTGGAGKAGRSTVADLVEHGHEVLDVDQVTHDSPAATLRTELTELGEVFEVLAGADAVVHLAAIPAPGRSPAEVTFRNNTLSTYNVFSAATTLRIPRVVWASSETTFGVPLSPGMVRYAPIDEEHPLQPHHSYGLSKVVAEELARYFAARSRDGGGSGTSFVGLRISNIITPDAYDSVFGAHADPHTRSWNLWGYIDSRDVAQACRLGLTADVEGADAFIVAAADTAMPAPSRELLAAVYPDVALADGHGEHESLLSSAKAARVLGYAPAHSWRDLQPRA